MNPKLLAIIKREYLQQVRSKAFWISTFLIPGIGLAIIFINIVLSRGMVSKGRIGVVDLTGRLYAPLLAEHDADTREEAAEEKKPMQNISESEAIQKASDSKKPKIKTKLEFVKVDATAETLAAVRKRLNEEVQSEHLKAYIVLDQKTLEPDPGVRLPRGKKPMGLAEWRAQSVKAEVVMREKIAGYLMRAVTKERLRDRGVDPAVYEAARLPVDLEPHEAKEIESGESGKNVGFNLAVSATFFFLIYMSIFIYGSYIMRGVLEEKNNRIVEVIVSSVKPTTLMLGKIFGIGLVGLTQYAVWGLLAVGISLPGIALLMGMTDGMPAIPLGTIAAFIIFFLLGYFLYSSLYAALAAPFNTEQEAQQFVILPTMALVLTSTTWFFAYNQPNGTLAQVLSFFPFTSPLMMFMRISVQTPPAWQIGLSIGLLLVTIWAMAWFAGRVYRVGILMYGKKPTLPEIIRWAMQAD